ncbi:MAG: hypothetical protein C5B49_04920 [Bdellovibrio sp.]|nr:MAG: hypothetical protein C5B49_04920 [Bdellovibrio sp.]
MKTSAGLFTKCFTKLVNRPFTKFITQFITRLITRVRPVVLLLLLASAAIHYSACDLNNKKRPILSGAPHGKSGKNGKPGRRGEPNEKETDDTSPSLVGTEHFLCESIYALSYAHGVFSETSKAAIFKRTRTLSDSVLSEAASLIEKHFDPGERVFQLRGENCQQLTDLLFEIDPKTKEMVKFQIIDADKRILAEAIPHPPGIQWTFHAAGLSRGAGPSLAAQNAKIVCQIDYSSRLRLRSLLCENLGQNLGTSGPEYFQWSKLDFVRMGRDPQVIAAATKLSGPGDTAGTPVVFEQGLDFQAITSIDEASKNRSLPCRKK